MILSVASLTCALTFGGVTPATFASQFQSAVAALQVQAADAEVTDQGVIMRVDLERKTFILNKADNSHIAISVDDDTVFMLDGEQSTMEDALKTGRSATVTHADRKASRVEVKTEA